MDNDGMCVAYCEDCDYTFMAEISPKIRCPKCKKLTSEPPADDGGGA